MLQRVNFVFFCQRNNHWSDQCRTVTDIAARLDILKSSRNCFKCLKKGHIQKNCRVRVKCYKCKSLNHHTALCKDNRENREVNNSATYLVNGETSVMLQTANGILTDRGER